mgnify:CR=1 FL=1
MLPISEKVSEYAKQVTEKLKAAGFRVHLDDRNEKVGKKIREAELAKVPYMFVVGEKELQENAVSVRRQGKGDLGIVPVDEMAGKLQNEIAERLSAE